MTEAADGTTTRETKVTRQLDLASLGHGPHPNIYSTSRSVTANHGVSHPLLDPPPGLHLIN